MWFTSSAKRIERFDNIMGYYPQSNDQIAFESTHKLNNLSIIRRYNYSLGLIRRFMAFSDTGYNVIFLNTRKENL